MGGMGSWAWCACSAVGFAAVVSCSSHDGPETGSFSPARIGAVRQMLDRSHPFPAVLAPGGTGYVVEAFGRGAGTRPDASRPTRVTVTRDAWTTIRLNTTGGGEVSIRHAPASDPSLRVEHGVVVLDDAFESMDALVFSTEAGVEELLVAREPGAEAVYQVELPEAWRLQRVSDVEGLVEIRDGRGEARSRVWARQAWDADGRSVPTDVRVEGERIRIRAEASSYPVVIDPEFQHAGTPLLPRDRGATTTLLPDGRILIAGADKPKSGVCELYNPQTGTFTATGKLATARYLHSSALLQTGQVLVSGGLDMNAGSSDALATAERYDLDSGTFEPAGDMTERRVNFTLTPLASGEVLAAGGVLSDAGVPHYDYLELYDPDTDGFVATSSKVVTRQQHSAHLLPDGDVLLVGGVDWINDSTPLVDRYDAATGAVDSTASLDEPRLWHTGVVLPSGDIVVCGGLDPSHLAVLASCERYEASTEAFSAFAPLNLPRALASGAVTGSGRLVLLGGLRWLSDSIVASVDLAESYGVGDEAWTLDAPFVSLWPQVLALPSGKLVALSGYPVSWELVTDRAVDVLPGRAMSRGRYMGACAALPDGSILVTGGTTGEDAWNQSPQIAAPDAEAFDPATGRFAFAGYLRGARYGHTATELPNGDLLLVGITQRAETWEAASRTFQESGEVGRRLGYHTATWIPSIGKVLIAGGLDLDAPHLLSQASLYDPATRQFEGTNSMTMARSSHRASLLPSGQVLVTGGWSSSHQALRDAEVYDPVKGMFTAAASMNLARTGHVSVLIPSLKKVLLAGGENSTNGMGERAELFNPATGTFELVGYLEANRSFGGAALLDGDRVLIAGGATANGQEGSVAWDYGEVYDPSTKLFESTGPMSAPRMGPFVAALPNTGKVLVAGGIPSWDGAALPSADIYDPDTATFTPTGVADDILIGQTTSLLPSGEVLVAGGGSPCTTHAWTLAKDDDQPTPAGSLQTARADHAATLLRDGSVLITGGQGREEALRSTELYDQATRVFSPGPDLVLPRVAHTATLLPSGQVLVAGGADAPDAEVFDGAVFETVGPLLRARSGHAAVLLGNGKVLVAGGVAPGTGAEPIAELELYDPESRSFSAAGALPIASRLSGIAVPPGNALLAGNGFAYRFSYETGAVTMISQAPDGVFGLAALWNGDIAACGSSCAFWDPSTGSFGGGTTLQSMCDGTLTVFSTGNLIVRQLDAAGQVSASVLRLSPVGAQRPVVDDVPPSFRIGETIDLTGTRFLRFPTAPEATDTPRPDLLPSVVFMPSAGGGPVHARLLSWSDTALRAVFPPTAYHGSGWLHVVVQGVPSLGRYALLQPRTDGTPCGFDAECEHGFCSEGVCCEARCSGACVSCKASLSGLEEDGLCGNLAEGQDPAELESTRQCAAEGVGKCGATGVCDGKGSCALYPDGTQCAPGRICQAQECYATMGERCTSSAQCALGQMCGETARCTDAVEFPVAVDSGACSTTGRGRKGGAWVWVVMGLLSSLRLLTQGRRRASRRR